MMLLNSIGKFSTHFHISKDSNIKKSICDNNWEFRAEAVKKEFPLVCHFSVTSFTFFISTLSSISVFFLSLYTHCHSNVCLWGYYQWYVKPIYIKTFFFRSTSLGYRKRRRFWDLWSLCSWKCFKNPSCSVKCQRLTSEFWIFPCDF